MQKEAKILWTTDNKDTSIHMVLLYAHNAKLKGWMDDVSVLVWGASQKLIAQDKEIQDKVKAMIDDGVKVTACLKCAQNMEIAEGLEACNIDVYYTGELLSNWIKSGDTIISV
ncbi:DsrE family protein [Halarcobacter ebronensis]|uniref:DsrE family protein n=1 Tax=Halarcobacter ebronensis TaxID=1462615 RepID=A0A4V1LR69_9BACT|nr:DsrE family protein [Halarcobacter ebronensis]RXJ67158.1 DsrE family protein [Halarcobacter ebronensis]